jgi:hypothetical protein
MNPPESVGWKTKLFGDNRFNFYGWIFGGLLIVGASLWLIIRAFGDGAGQSPTCQILLAIYLVQMGHLGLALQNYHARVARSLDAKAPGKDDANPP